MGRERERERDWWEREREMEGEWWKRVFRVWKGFWIRFQMSRSRSRQGVWREGVGGVLSNKSIEGHQGNMFFWVLTCCIPTTLPLPLIYYCFMMVMIKGSNEAMRWMWNEYKSSISYVCFFFILNFDYF